MAMTPQYLAVMQWCGFEPQHPPHLFGDIVRGSMGRQAYLLIQPCPGEMFSDELDDFSIEPPTTRRKESP